VDRTSQPAAAGNTTAATPPAPPGAGQARHTPSTEVAPATRSSPSSPSPALCIEVAVAKIGKYASRESGDTVEVTERPHGGLSVVLADGQGSGRAAKTLANIVAKRAIALLADGTRDGAAARAAHDYLFAYRHGQVSAELAIISADLQTETIVVSRNSHCPAILVHAGVVERWTAASRPIGLYRSTKPIIREVPIAPGTMAIVYSDGIHEAGFRRGQRFDVEVPLRPLVDRDAPAQEVADALLAGALAMDEGRPTDDMSVAVLAIRTAPAAGGARRMVLHFPLP
jgi:serine phosphatase RsbU (regulator of sigma subunit)